MCTFVYMDVYILMVELQILLFFFLFHRIPMIFNAGKMQNDVADKDTILL